jgi:DNA replication protein DnaC
MRAKKTLFQSHAELDQLLHRLGLSTFREHYQNLAEASEKSSQSHLAFLHDLCVRESEHRDHIRQMRLLKSAKLPRHKVLSDFAINRIPGLSPALIHRLSEGDFMDRPENILIFGNPGTGKTHLAIALAREWCLMGRRILFKGASQIVEELLQAQENKGLQRFMKQLDRFDCLIIDDISYVPFKREETDVLFQLINQRYEKRSLLITSNLAFSQWKSIFQDEMATAALIDRLVHHAEILELNAPSYRAEKAQNRNKISVLKPSDAKSLSAQASTA